MNALPMLVLVLVVLSLIGYSLRQPIQQVLLMRRAARGAIGTLPTTGIVAVSGRAIGEGLRSPLTDTPCVLWQVEVLEQRYKQMAQLFKQGSTEPFSIDDGTGQVLVLPEGGQLQLSDDLYQSRGLLSRISPEIEAKMAQLGVPIQGAMGQAWRSLRVYERYIASDEPIFALGAVERRDGQTILQMTSPTPLFLADRSEREVLRSLYRRIGSAVGAMVLIVVGFSCCVMLSVIDRQ